MGITDVHLDEHRYVMASLHAIQQKFHISSCTLIRRPMPAVKISVRKSSQIRRKSYPRIRKRFVPGSASSGTSAPTRANHHYYRRHHPLGADDKARVVAIMWAAQYLMEHPEVSAVVKIALLPTKRLAGVAKFDVQIWRNMLYHYWRAG